MLRGAVPDVGRYARIMKCFHLLSVSQEKYLPIIAFYYLLTCLAYLVEVSLVLLTRILVSPALES